MKLKTILVVLGMFLGSAEALPPKPMMPNEGCGAGLLEPGAWAEGNLSLVVESIEDRPGSFFALLLDRRAHSLGVFYLIDPTSEIVGLYKATPLQMTRTWLERTTPSHSLFLRYCQNDLSIDLNDSYNGRVSPNFNGFKYPQGKAFARTDHLEMTKIRSGGAYTDGSDSVEFLPNPFLANDETGRELVDLKGIFKGVILGDGVYEYFEGSGPVGVVYPKQIDASEQITREPLFATFFLNEFGDNPGGKSDALEIVGQSLVYFYAVGNDPISVFGFLPVE